MLAVGVVEIFLFNRLGFLLCCRLLKGNFSWCKGGTLFWGGWTCMLPVFTHCYLTLRKKCHEGQARLLDQWDQWWKLSEEGLLPCKNECTDLSLGLFVCVWYSSFLSALLRLCFYFFFLLPPTEVLCSFHLSSLFLPKSTAEDTLVCTLPFYFSICAFCIYFHCVCVQYVCWN